MPKILDLNNITLPSLELKFAGASPLTLHINAPTEGLIHEMENWVKNDLESLAAGDKESVEMSYDIMARLISCNEEGVSLSASELKEKIAETPACKKNNADPLWVFIQIAQAYMEFISELKNEKN